MEAVLGKGRRKTLRKVRAEKNGQRFKVPGRKRRKSGDGKN